MIRLTKIQTGLMSTIVALMLASCSPITNTRGYTSDDLDLKQIIVGQSKADDVTAILGSPSVRSSFGDDIWYYITQKKETRGPFEPVVVEQQVTAIRFDKSQTVADISDYKKEQGKSVEIISKTTPSEGHSLGFMEQMLGNFGKFNAPGRGISSRDMGR